jgi:hypothetical protein
VTTELATCFNLCIMPITWFLLMPPIIRAWGAMVVDPQYGNWWLWSMVWDHTMPMIMTSIQLIITDMVFLKRDALITFTLGFIYVFADYGGLEYRGTPVYDFHLLNWDDWWLTFRTFTIQSIVMVFIHISIACCGQACHKFKEKEEQFTGAESANRKSGKEVNQI